MSAGMVSVPAIIPLKIPGLGATGSRKWSVDTNTPIEMHSTTKGCLIFFTLDGTKPDPFKKIGDKTTYQYTKAITLPSGKKTLKAIAMLKDGSKESNINTKVFQVAVAVEEEEETEKSKMNTTWHNQNSDEEKLDGRMFKKVMRSSEERLPQEKKDPVRKILTDTSYNTNDSFENGGIKEDEYFLCTYCGEPRPVDPYARFCNGCNSILPPAPGRIRSPQFTGSFQSALKKSPKKKIECKNCGTSNPMETSECLVCDSPLSGISISKIKKDKAPEASTGFIVCPYCTRVNSGNARFCDWCGEKSNSKSRTISCQQCMTENLVSSQFCCSCGKKLLAPPRESLEKILDQGDLKIKESNSKSGGQLELLEKLTEGEKQNWKNIEFDSVTRKQSKNVAIQAGDSVISAMQKLSLKEQGTNSPGKGFWRQQVDYVAQHFKVYTQNNVNFRAQFSNQTLSNLLSVELHEPETEKNVKELVLTFSIPEDNAKAKKNKKMKTVNSGETLINAMKQSSRPSSGRSRPSSGRSRPSSASTKQPFSEGADSPRSNHGDSRPSSGRKPKLSQKALEKEKLNAFYAQLSPDTKKLLNLVKASKEPDVDEIESLLDSDDIDINTNDENGTPLLKLAVQNKHFEILQSLIIAGADIDAVSGTKTTTALHEAVMLGMSGKDAVEILLDNEASYTIKDKRGKSAHDLAIDNGADAILSIFNQHTSKGLLKDVMKL